jgi:hypothetical protein
MVEGGSLARDMHAARICWSVDGRPGERGGGAVKVGARYATGAARGTWKRRLERVLKQAAGEGRKRNARSACDTKSRHTPCLHSHGLASLVL